MKKILTFLILLTLAIPCRAAVDTFTDSIAVKRTWLNGFAWTGHVPKDRAFRWAKEVEDRIDGTTSTTNMYFTPTDTEPTVSEGRMYYDLSEHKLKFRNATDWVAIEAGSSGNSLDGAYNVGSTITVDNGAVTLTSSDAASNVVLALEQEDTDGTVAALTVTSAGDAAGILIAQSGSGTDIEGSDGWSISKLSALIIEGGITDLTDGSAILFDTNNEIQFGDNSEDVSFGFGTSDTLTWTTDSSIDKVNWGDLDAHSGLAALAGDIGADFAISAANTGTFNLTVSQTGVGDNELRLASAGTATNAVALAASTGGVTVTTGSGANGDFLVTTGDDVIITSGDDTTLTSTVGSLYNIGTDDTTADTITIGSAKDTISVDGIAVTIGSTAGTSATTIQSGTGDISVTSTDDLTISGTTNSVISIAANAAAQLVTVGNETGVSSLHLLAGTGDIDMQGVAASTITIGDAAQTAAITIGASTATMTDLSLGTGAGAHTIHIGDGGTAAQIVTIGSTSAASAVTIQSGTGNLALTSTDDITLTVNTDSGDNITITNTPGTAENAIVLLATAGGIDVDFATGKNMAITGGQ
ncbi:hypothetical protein LCGC14_1971720, partial [marine sediment metagenome]